jgi:hypothetical protein
MPDLEFTIECSNCNRKIKIKVKDMVPGHTRNCPYCGLTIQFTGDDGRKAQQALDDLEKTLENMGKKFKKLGKR